LEWALWCRGHICTDYKVKLDLLPGFVGTQTLFRLMTRLSCWIAEESTVQGPLTNLGRQGNNGTHPTMTHGPILDLMALAIHNDDPVSTGQSYVQGGPHQKANPTASLIPLVTSINLCFRWRDGSHLSRLWHRWTRVSCRRTTRRSERESQVLGPTSPPPFLSIYPTIDFLLPAPRAR
jgi:hypothetical protein